MTDAIPSVLYNAIFIVCEHKISFSHVLIQNYLLWIFELYLYYWSQSKKGLNGSWPDMMDLTNLPSLMQEITIWLWCEVSFHAFPPRPDLGYLFHPWLSQRGNWSKVHIHQNIFFIYFFPPPFQMELTGTCWRNKMQVAVLNSTVRARPFRKPFVTQNATSSWWGGGKE